MREFADLINYVRKGKYGILECEDVRHFFDLNNLEEFQQSFFQKFLK